MDSDNSERVRAFRGQAEELRDAAEQMKFRESRAAMIILAESYDRLADKLDVPDKFYGTVTAGTSATRPPLSPASANDDTADRQGSSRGS